MSFQNIYVGKTPAVPYFCSRNAAGPIKGTLSTRNRSKFYEQWLTRKASEHDDMSRDGDFQCSFSRSLIRFLLRVLQLQILLGSKYSDLCFCYIWYPMSQMSGACSLFLRNGSCYYTSSAFMHVKALTSNLLLGYRESASIINTYAKRLEIKTRRYEKWNPLKGHLFKTTESHFLKYEPLQVLC